MKRGKWFRQSLLVLGCLMMQCTLIKMDVSAAGSLYESSYVTFSLDGQAWTFNQALPGGYVDGRPACWYAPGYTISTGIPSSLRTLEKGEHYYAVERYGEVPVGEWRVQHAYATCIHRLSTYPEYYHGIDFGTQICFAPYFSGWGAYCADCGQHISSGLVYGSKEAVSSVNSINVNLGQYYLCPSCNHLEQGRDAGSHSCKAISYNRYRVIYKGNLELYRDVVGDMPDSFHMYNNETLFEGEPITPNMHLTRNGFRLEGYHFTGWNTKPDGSGTAYADGAEIFNLSNENYDEDTETGSVILYAQWVKVETNLVIDPNGGSYQGKKETTTIRKEYGDEYILDSEKVVPPDGYTVNFNTNGGNALASMTSTQTFEKWVLLAPFNGVLRNGEQYLFRGPMDSTDTIKAFYLHHPITLPTPIKDNASFGGWYRNPECTDLVGYGGDPFIPNADTTLYAKWVELVLHAEDNYTANNGKGAVDLSWTQADGKNKTYKLYQSQNGIDFKQIYSAEDATTPNLPDNTFGCTGETKTVTIPYTGFYSLTASGAQGGNYGSYQGGKGGFVTGKFYLEKGEVLTFTVGGQNGYNGGGDGTTYGNGGGYTIISSDQKGTLLIGGGGGGATEEGNGGGGGEETGLLEQEPSELGNIGETGGAGGGGGYRGGLSGAASQQTVYQHKHGSGCWYSCGYIEGLCEQGQRGEDCSLSEDDGGHDCRPHVHENSCFACLGTLNYKAEYTGSYVIEAWGAQGGYSTQNCSGYIGYGGNGGYAAGTILLNAGTDIYFSIGTKGSDAVGSPAGYGEGRHSDIGGSGGETKVWLNSGTLLRADGGGGGQSSCWNFGGTNMGDSADNGVGGGGQILSQEMINTSTTVGANSGGGWVKITYVASSPAYGGASYINTEYAVTYSQERSSRTGNGEASLKTLTVGFQEEQHLNGVSAPDLAAPLPVSVIEKTVDENNTLVVTFAEPHDNGTAYYHRAESYEVETEMPLCVSNVTKNTLVSGVAGYYYKINTEPVTVVTADNADNAGQLLVERKIVPSKADENAWIHLAAADVAGNISETVHIRLDGNGVAWRLSTDALQISSAIHGRDRENIYPAADRSWYVLADGNTPFMLSYDSHMHGEARTDYQVNYQILDSEVDADGINQRYTVKLPYTVPLSSTADLDSTAFAQGTTGDAVLGDWMYTEAARSNNAADTHFSKAFTLHPEMHGKTIVVMPRAGADFKDDVIYSDREADARNALELIADGEGPVISGLEELGDSLVIDRKNQTVNLVLSASDEQSGVKNFYLQVNNTDNYGERTYEADENGKIPIEITQEDPLFTGDFTLKACAVDNVGNATEEVREVTEFALETRIERILEPHTPIFKRGESGILYITAYGYAEKLEVEFPEELRELNPNLNKTFTYEIPQYRQEEQLQFMIPLYAPENESYEITVRAYKGDSQIEDYPAFSTIAVDGSILDEIRTRLR